MTDVDLQTVAYLDKNSMVNTGVVDAATGRGVNKHRDVPIQVSWDENRQLWIQTDDRQWAFNDVTQKFEELFLTKMRLTDILAGWKPDSYALDKSWADEHFYLSTQDQVKTFEIRELILQKGFGFDDLKKPIKLGNNGVVWDGHHRLVIAMELKPEFLWVDIVPPITSN